MLREAHGKPATLSSQKPPGRPHWLQVKQVKRLVGEFKFGLQPVIQFVPRLSSTFPVDFESPSPDLIFGWTINPHGSPCGSDNAICYPTP